MVDGRPAFRHADDTPPQEWIAVVLTELLEGLGLECKIPQTLFEKCKIPLVDTTAELRGRLEKHEQAFFTSMRNLGARVFQALDNSELDFEAFDLGQKLCERIPLDLAAKVEPPPPAEPEPVPEPEPTVKVETPEEEDPVWAANREALHRRLLSEGAQTLAKLAKKPKFAGQVGADGGPLTNGWRVDTTEVPPKYKADALPRGKHAAKGPRSEGALDDEPTEEELYDAEVAAELAAAQAAGEEGEHADEAGEDGEADPAKEGEPGASAASEEQEGAKRPRREGPKQSLTKRLKLYLIVHCELCGEDLYAHRMDTPIISHRTGKRSCVRSGRGKAFAAASGGRSGSRARIDAFIMEPPPKAARTSAPPSGRSPAVAPRNSTPQTVPPPRAPSSGDGGSMRAGSGRSGGGRGSRGGRGNKGAAAKAADKARVAALMAARKEVERAGGSWDPIRGCARKESCSPAEPADDEVECIGTSTRKEAEAARDAAAQEEAVDLTASDPTSNLSSALAAASNPATSQPSSDTVNAGAEDSEDEAVGGGKAGEPEDVTFSQADLSQTQGDDE